MFFADKKNAFAYARLEKSSTGVNHYVVKTKKLMVDGYVEGYTVVIG